MGSAKGTMTFAIVCEANADRLVYGGLVDRVLQSHVDWWDPSTVDTLRQWTGFDASETFLPVKEVSTRYEALRRVNRVPRVYGDFGTGDRGAEFLFARKAILLLAHSAPSTPDAILLARDMDQQESRRRGWMEAARLAQASLPILVFVPQHMLEAWLLAGFEPVSADELVRLNQIRQELGFDPRLQAERLRAQDETAKTSAKRVLNRLTDDDSERRSACLDAVPLDTLSARGANSGLSEALAAVRSQLVPLFQ